MEPFREVAQRRNAVLAAALLTFVLFEAAAGTQLRPVAPVDWRLVSGERSLSLGIGIGLLNGQRASLAGTRGDLREYGNYRIGLRSGRIALDVAGTVLRRFEDREVLQAPAAGSHPSTREVRRDAGDVVVSTAILINEAGSARAALRFGTRLPTPSNEVGLDRDRTDFFSTIAGRWAADAVVLMAEGGLAILGTRVDRLDQLDVLVYATGVELSTGPVTSTAIIVGQDDVHSGVVRGNEDLSEIRFGLAVGDRMWLSATTVFGLSDYSPGRGLLIMAGLRR